MGNRASGGATETKRIKTKNGIHSTLTKGMAKLRGQEGDRTVPKTSFKKIDSSTHRR